MSKYSTDEEPQFLFEINHIRFEEIFKKMAEMEETINQMKIKMKAQDDLIDVLYTKQIDSKVLKKEIKLLKENLVNQGELMEDVKNITAIVTNNKDDQIKLAREKVYNELTDMVGEIISKQPPPTHINEDEFGYKTGTTKITNSIVVDFKFGAVEKTNAIIVEVINNILAFNNSKQMFVLAEIISSIKAHFTSPPVAHGLIFTPYQLRRHAFLQNFINRLFNCNVKDGHRITVNHLTPGCEDINGLQKKYVSRTLKLIEVFVVELLEIGEYKG